MAIKFISAKCPDCGASLDVEEGRDMVYCSYCGSKIMIEKKSVQIVRHIDEASLKRAETERMIQVKKIEFAEKKRKAREKTKMIKIKFSIFFGLVIAISVVTVGLGAISIGLISGGLSAIILVAMWSGKKDDDYELDDRIKAPFGPSVYEKITYMDVEKKLNQVGFYYVTFQPLSDLTLGLLKQPDMVKSITIKRHDMVQGKKYPYDVPIVVTYHSYSKK